ncbi:MAG TPA: NAD-dependent epimerase/dehydratase family protein [Stellaceae bacterium]|nr:NAD-dependent epimerase/dehydratase family protein [Stellaceae bacterium]
MADRRAVLVLGAAGFIGRALVARFVAEGTPAVAAVRADAAFGAGVAVRVTGTLSAASDWPALLAGCGAVVHLAGRAHRPAEAGEAWIAAEAATAAALAGAARAAGIERLVLMSSVKVHGEDSGAGRFRASDPPVPADPYGRAKLAVEAAMRSEAESRLVVLRPPLVYGPEVTGNFLALLRLVDCGLPLPFAAIANRRSLIFRDNLVDLVLVALTHPEAPGGTFLLRDDEEVATPRLVQLIAAGLDRPARLFACPPRLLGVAARLIGRGNTATRLVASLSVDDGPTRTRLGWRPRVALADGIAVTCRWYRAAHGPRRASHL